MDDINEINPSLTISLKEYIDLRFKMIDKSTDLALSSLNKRLDSMNEFRTTLKDQTNTFLTKVEHEAVMKNIDSDIRILRESKAQLEGKASQSSVYVGYAFTAVAILMAIISLFIRFMK
jgi:hypothetical protein